MVLSDPLSGLIGGFIIGLAASILLVFNGDIMGFSGIFTSSVLRQTKQGPNWKLVYLGAFLVTTQVMMFYPYIKVPDPEVQDYIPIASPIAHVLAGLFVGFGTKMGNGCTSGHGICGMARLSVRSFVAVITFMITAAVTVYVISPVSIFAPYTSWLRRDAVPNPARILGYVITAVFIMVAFILMRYENKKHKDINNVPVNEDSLLVDEPTGNAAQDSQDQDIEQCKLIAAAVSGSLMSVGLALSQMIAPSKIYGFLDLTGYTRGTWDPTLAFVMGGGVIISSLSYALIGYPNLLFIGKKDRASAMQCPLALKNDGSFSVPSSTTVDGKLIGGAAIFGIGWAMAGMCPGPALFLVGSSVPFVAFLWLPSYVFGAYVAQRSMGGTSRPASDS
jgi:hypothetical protein